MYVLKKNWTKIADTSQNSKRLVIERKWRKHRKFKSLIEYMKSLKFKNKFGY